MFEELNPPYGTIVADPPWRYETTNPPNGSPGHKGGAPLPYSGMDLEEIKSLPVGRLADDARLFLWTTNRYLRHAWDVVEAWGFTPQDRVLVWCKLPRCTAQITTEFVLVAKKGKPPRMPWTGTTWYQWPLQPVHSQKPDAFMDLVEQWCPGPYLELFCRRPRFGWDSWGYGYELGATE